MRSGDITLPAGAFQALEPLIGQALQAGRDLDLCEALAQARISGAQSVAVTLSPGQARRLREWAQASRAAELQELARRLPPG